MSNLQHRQSIIQEKRKATPWRDFVMEICSRHSFDFYRNNGKVSRYPKTGREGMLDDLSDQYNLNTTGIDYRANFLYDFSELWSNTAKGYLLKFFGDENCVYADAVFGAKNGYLSFEIGFDEENVLYSFLIFSNVSDVISSVASGDNSSVVFQSLSVGNSSNIFYSKDIDNSHEIWFSSNIVGCKECILCTGLINQEFCIDNIRYDYDEYYIKKNSILNKKQDFWKLFENVGVNFNNTKFSTNCMQTYWSKHIHNGKNLIYAVGGENSSTNMYDSIDVGINSSDFYGASAAGNNSYHIYCSTQINTCANIFYSFHLDNCSFCLGCIGLKNKTYCILNKQYTKEERYEKVDEIFGQMYEDGTLGDFFPATMNPFYFNDTAAYLIGSSLGSAEQQFTKEEVTAGGYLRRDEPIKVDIPEGALVVKTSELGRFEGFRGQGEIPRLGTELIPDLASGGQVGNKMSEYTSHSSIFGHLSKSSDILPENQKQWAIDPEILKYIIQDEQGNVYRIVKMEYDFLMKYGLPLPRKHRLDRMKENFRIN